MPNTFLWLFWLWNDFGIDTKGCLTNTANITIDLVYCGVLLPVGYDPSGVVRPNLGGRGNLSELVQEKIWIQSDNGTT